MDANTRLAQFQKISNTTMEITLTLLKRLQQDLGDPETQEGNAPFYKLFVQEAIKKTFQQDLEEQQESPLQSLMNLGIDGFDPSRI